MSLIERGEHVGLDADLVQPCLELGDLVGLVGEVVQEIVVFPVQCLELVFQALDVLFFSLSKGALRCSILCSTPL